MVAMAEAKELSEKGLLTGSCCPALVQYIKSAFPNLVEHISHNHFWTDLFCAESSGTECVTHKG